MKMSCAVHALAAGAALWSCGIARAEAPAVLNAKDAVAIGTEAYIYGYPLVTMDMTRRVMTNVEKPEGTRAPMGQLVRMRTYPNAQFRDVTAPNADTLYTTAWMDVGTEPWVLSIPDADGRYFLMPMLDGWTDVFQVPGTRTTGTKPQTYVITGPNWKGQIPQGMTEYKSPTSMVWLLGRIYCSGTPEDYKAVHAMQDKVSIQPLSTWGKTYTPGPGKVDASIDMKKAVREQVNSMTAEKYFETLANLLKDNPPAAADAPMVAKLAKLGVVPGKPFVAGKFAKAVEAAPKPAQAKILGHFKTAGSDVNGWVFTTKTGVYGTDYLQRALVTAIGLGANRPQDAIYPTAETDSERKPFDGASRYTMTFAKGQMPPVDAFWSLTMYDAGYFFSANALNRYTLSSRSKLKPNPDGSVTLRLQHESPGKDLESNWLPAPKGKFILMMRLYWPKEKAPSILDGSWKIPPVVRTK